MSLIETIALAQRIATGTCGHAGRERELANAILALDTALTSCRANDRSAIYGPGESRRDGQRPKDEGRWQTPREIVENLFAPTRPAAPRSEAAQAALAVERAQGDAPHQPGEPA